MGTLAEIRMKNIDLKEGTVHYQHTKTEKMSEHYMHVYANSVKERFIENNLFESLTRRGPRKSVQRND